MSCKYKHKVGNIYAQIGNPYLNRSSTFMLSTVNGRGPENGTPQITLLTMDGNRWSDPPVEVKDTQKITMVEMNKIANTISFNKKFKQIIPDKLFNKEVLRDGG